MFFRTPAAKKAFRFLATLIVMTGLIPQSVASGEAQGAYKSYLPAVFQSAAKAVVPTPTPTQAPTAAPTAAPTPEATLPSLPTGGTNWYAAPNGSSSGNGSKDRPWDIITALSGPSSVRPGDTIWLRGGTYGPGGSARVTSVLNGQPGLPIIVRGYPGERATVNEGILAKGQYTYFWGFEITNTDTNRFTDATGRPPGLYMVGRGHKAINLLVNNTGHPGIGFWTEVGDGGEVYGCIIWGTGTYDTSKVSWTDGRGSAIYAQNQNGSHLVKDVISFRNLTTGMKAYAENGYVNGFTFEGNISFENGDRLLFVAGGVNPSSRTRMINNYTYRAPDDSFSPVRLGYADADQNDAVVQGNWFVDGTHSDGAIWVKRFKQLNVTNNVLIGPSMLATWIPAAASNAVTWNNNKYYGGVASPFRVNTTVTNWSGWKTKTGFDANSTYTASRPTGVNYFVRPNIYEPNRANLVVYNWDHAGTVQINPSGFLAAGQTYRIYDAQNPYGSPVATGTYNGGTISLPMNLTAVAEIRGEMPFVNDHTSNEFGAFVIFK